ncbi:hypothetical protein [Aquamicrobium defluvii]|uniref:Uncharacterized protein n=1 Tax=Aquamicrobium defluvii TaxID=69279 RepID=A0A4R6YGM5_9HYPH|nr:hypothetical protein [Aquamicrobium defluvii]TDR35682.1 hypothetical protein DES43_108107 [Aquamicrobium defluvii]
MTDRTIAGLNVDMKISLGNIIVIGTLLVTIVGGWATLKSQTEQNTVDIAKNTTRIERLETGSGDMKDRLTRMEVTLQNLTVQVDRVVRAVERRPVDLPHQ